MGGTTRRDEGGLEGVHERRSRKGTIDEIHLCHNVDNKLPVE